MKHNSKKELTIGELINRGFVNKRPPGSQIVNEAKAIGEIVKKVRKETGQTQADAAALCGVGTRFISDLENGKPTLQLQYVLKVLNAFGLEVSIQRRGL